MKAKRAASILILASLLASAASCGQSPTGTNVATDNPDDSTTPADTSAQVVTLETSGLPIKDFEGREFIAVTNSVSNMAHTWYLLSPDELNGDTLNDIMYNRNKKIEELYNISISTYYTTSAPSTVSNAVKAGDDTYSAILGKISDTYPQAQDGIYTNFYDIDYINLDGSWWDQSVVRDLTYKDTLYMLTGDISPATNVRVYTLVFNKDLCTDLGLEMPYQYVLDGSWTIDRFNKYITDVNRDLNGDSVMDHEDRWGFYSQEGCSWMMYFSAGGRVVTKDANGDLSLAYNTERSIQLATEALEIASDKNKTLMANQYVANNGGNWSSATAWFSSGGALFRSSVLEPIPRDLRSLDVNFGVVPYPKLDENQEQYYTLPEEYSWMLSVPVTADTEFTGLILEALAIESVSTVSPAFYDVCLNGKVVRDEESKAMLDIIFNSKVFDIGFFSNIASFRSMLTNLEKKGSTDVASAYASSLSAAETSLQKICDNFESLK